MTPAVLGLSHVGLSVRDRNAARYFWMEVMGFELINDCWATCGGVKIYQPTAVVYADGATS